MSFYSPVSFSSQALPITYTGSAVNPAGTNRFIGANGAANEFFFNVPASGLFRYAVGGTEWLRYNGGYLAYTGYFGAGVSISGGASRKIESLDTAAAQLRLTYTAGSVYTDFLADSGGNLTLKINGSSRFKFTGSQMATDANAIIGTNIAATAARKLEVLDAAANYQIRGSFTQATKYFDMGIDTSSLFRFEINGASVYSATTTDLTTAVPLIWSTNVTNPAGSVRFINLTGGDLNYNVGTGNTHTFMVNAVKNALFGTDIQFGSGTAALATNATAGFVHIPGCAGTPTGVPASLITGSCPLVVDTTNNKLYAYYGAAWHSLSP